VHHEYLNKHIYSTGNGFEKCVREETACLETLKSKKYTVHKLTAFLKTLQRLKQEWQKSPALGPGKQTVKLGLV
jgi:hypothetical protein